MRDTSCGRIERRRLRLLSPAEDTLSPENTKIRVERSGLALDLSRPCRGARQDANAQLALQEERRGGRRGCPATTALSAEEFALICNL